MLRRPLALQKIRTTRNSKRRRKKSGLVKVSTPKAREMNAVLQQLKEEAGTAHLLAPYVQCPPPVLDAFVDFLELAPDSSVTEIGFGDARIMRRIVERTKLAVTGFEVDPEALEDAETQRQEMEESLRGHLRLFGKDAMQAEPEECDWTTVDVCYGYLTKAGLRQVYPQLQEKMRPGAAFYCIQFSVDGAEACEESTFDFVDERGESQSFKFYRYEI